MQNPQEKTVVIGAMHRVAEGQMFSKCVHCGAMAEKLSKPCPAYMAEAAQLLKAATATGSTPGPWTVEDIGTDCLFIRGNVPQEGANAELREYYSNIATVTQRGAHPRYGGGIERATTLANARLIACAPEMLEAMKRRVKNAEERAFEDWLARERPSGDVESVQRQWEESSDLADLQAEWSSEIALITNATGSTS